jgi:hypothetical protein
LEERGEKLSIVIYIGGGVRVSGSKKVGGYYVIENEAEKSEENSH